MNLKNRNRLTLLVFFSTFAFANSLYCADSYNIGDKLFVWARSGLNIRKTPSINSNKLDRVLFGDSVWVIGKTEIEYNVLGIANHDHEGRKRVNDVIFYGNWIKVKSQNGLIGYVIDQYLIRVKPYTKDHHEFGVLPINELSRDTLYHSENFSDGEGLNFIIEVIYEFGIKETVKSGGVWNSSSLVFDGFSIEEALILLNYDSSKYKLKVETNWKNKLKFNDEDGICGIEVEKIDSMVTVKMSCSC